MLGSLKLFCVSFDVICWLILYGLCFVICYHVCACYYMFFLYPIFWESFLKAPWSNFYLFLIALGHVITTSLILDELLVLSTKLFESAQPLVQCWAMASSILTLSLGVLTFCLIFRNDLSWPRSSRLSSSVPVTSKFLFSSVPS